MRHSLFNLKMSFIKELAALQPKIAEAEEALKEFDVEGQKVGVITHKKGEDTNQIRGNHENNCMWTAYHVLAQVDRFASAMGDEERDTAEKSARESFRALVKLYEITGKPGLIARGFEQKEDEEEENFWDYKKYFWRERTGKGKSEWHNGKSEFANYRFLTNPGKGQLEGFLTGVQKYFDSPIASETEKQSITKIATEIAEEYVIKNNYKIVDLDDETTTEGHAGKITLKSSLAKSVWKEAIHCGPTLRRLSLLKTLQHLTKGEEVNTKITKLYEECFREKATQRLPKKIFKEKSRIWKNYFSSFHLEFLAIQRLSELENDEDKKEFVQKLEQAAQEYAIKTENWAFCQESRAEVLKYLKKLPIERKVDFISAKPRKIKSGKQADSKPDCDEFNPRLDPRCEVGWVKDEKSLEGRMEMPPLDLLWVYYRARYRAAFKAAETSG